MKKAFHLILFAVLLGVVAPSTNLLPQAQAAPESENSNASVDDKAAEKERKAAERERRKAEREARKEEAKKRKEERKKERERKRQERQEKLSGGISGGDAA